MAMHHLQYRCKTDIYNISFPSSLLVITVDTSLPLYIFFMQHAGIELGPPLRRYATNLYTRSHKPHSLNFHTRVCAGKEGGAHYPWRRSLLIRAFSLEMWDWRRTIAWGRCTPLTIVDQFGIKISRFTPSFEALGRLLKKIDHSV